MYVLLNICFYFTFIIIAISGIVSFIEAKNINLIIAGKFLALMIIVIFCSLQVLMHMDILVNFRKKYTWGDIFR